jgi:hypothetical protein
MTLAASPKDDSTTDGILSNMTYNVNVPAAPQSPVYSLKTKAMIWLENVESSLNASHCDYTNRSAAAPVECYEEPGILCQSNDSASVYSSTSIITDERDADDPVSEVTDYGEEMNQTTSCPTRRQSSLSPSLLTFGLRILRIIRSEVQILFDTNSNFTSCTNSSSSHSSSQDIQSSSTSTAPQSHAFSKKHTREDEGSKSPNNGRGNGSGKRRRESGGSLARLALYLRLACPFYKRNPEIHQKWRSCAGPGWDTVHRVKCVSPYSY